MKCYRLEVSHQVLLDITEGKRTFVVVAEHYEVGDIVFFIDKNDKIYDNPTEKLSEVTIDSNAVYKITYGLEVSPDNKICIYSIKRLC